MIEQQNIDNLYQRIGEFVVSFQWLEDKIRQIGWLINDPTRKEYPPRILREESNHELISKVEQLYSRAMDVINTEDSLEKKRSFSKLMIECNKMRKYRNTLLHSAYIELKAGGEVTSIARFNPKIKSASDGKITFDQEILTEESIMKQMESLANMCLAANIHYMQLIHWADLLQT